MDSFGVRLGEPWAQWQLLLAESDMLDSFGGSLVFDT